MSIGQALQRTARAVAPALLGAALAAAGCGGGGGGEAPPPTPPPADTQGPSITGLSVAPTSLRFPGGNVTIAANVTDASGVSRVWAVVTRPDSGTESKNLSQTGADTYTVVWSAPGNPEVGGPTLTYTIYVYAEDTKGNTNSIGPSTVSVEAVDSPPPLPTS